MKNAVIKSVIVVLFSLCLAVSIAAQEKPCELAWKTAPLLLNLRIGMSPQQAQTVFVRDLKIKVKKTGERTFFQNYIKKPATGSLTGVRALYLRFFNNSLYQIEIFYEPRTDLKTLEDITDKLASQLNFLFSGWQIKYNRAETICGEISLVADNILNPRIELTDENIRARIEEAREKDKK